MIDKLKEKSVMFNSALKVWKNHKICISAIVVIIAAAIIL